jgi:hypothetical protein
MPTKRYKREQIVTLLRQIEVEIANEKTTSQPCKEWRRAPTVFKVHVQGWPAVRDRSLG